jgi:hypothetical protein
LRETATSSWVKKTGFLSPIKEIVMAATGLLGIIILLCGGLVVVTAVAVVIYLVVKERDK